MRYSTESRNDGSIIFALVHSVSWASTLGVRDVRIGRNYTAIRVITGEVGVAYNFPGGSGCTGHGFGSLRPLAGKTVAELLPLLGSSDLLASSVALAAINASVSHTIHRDVRLIPGDVLEHVHLNRDDSVGMIGFFGPLIQPIRRSVKSLRVVDLDCSKNADILPPEAAPDVLSSSSVALISSTSIVNSSLSTLLEATSGCREVILLGPSTPLVPEAFQGTPVTWLSGVLINEPERVLETVSEAGGMCFFKKFITKVNVPVDTSSN